MTEIPASMVRELFDYRDGKLFWEPRQREHFISERGFKTWNSRYPGKEIGCKHRSGYRYVRIKFGGKQKYLMHRLVWAWHYGSWPKDQLDHIDHDRSNDRIENLREVTRAENMKNMSMSKNNTSGVTGVHWHKQHKKWAAQIRTSRKTKHLGYFENFEDAVEVRKDAEKLYGYHQNHGKAAS